MKISRVQTDWLNRSYMKSRLDCKYGLSSTRSSQDMSRIRTHEGNEIYESILRTKKRTVYPIIPTGLKVIIEMRRRIRNVTK